MHHAPCTRYQALSYHVQCTMYQALSYHVQCTRYQALSNHVPCTMYQALSYHCTMHYNMHHAPYTIHGCAEGSDHKNATTKMQSHVCMHAITLSIIIRWFLIQIA